MRGSPFHNAIAQRVADLFIVHGYATTLEVPLPLPDGRTDFVDVLAWKGDVRIAAEIETTPRYVLVNVAKAAMLSLPLIIVVPTRRLERAVNRRLIGKLGQNTGQVWVRTLAQMPQLLTSVFRSASP